MLIIFEVETAKDSAPILSLLAPLNSGSRHSYWRAPPCTTSVEFVIVLGSVSDVSGVILLVSPCGYSVGDTPMVKTHLIFMTVDQVSIGLSLSNRIKLYYYCDPYELGKWASLFGV
ncbi:hypothetical protein WN943_015931 [Citrus x changshan-huyou]